MGEMASELLELNMELRMLGFAFAAIAAVPVSVDATPIQSLSMYVVDSTRHLLAVDISSGIAKRLGATGAPLTDIAAHNDGRLFGISTSALYELNPQTGSSTLIGHHGFGDPALLAGIDALAFGTDGALYAAGNDLLISLDLATGRGTRIGTLSGFRSAGDLTTDAQGRLVLSTDTGMWVNAYEDGSGATWIGSIPHDDVFALGTTPSGEVIGIRENNRILKIDSHTGQSEVIGTLAGDFLTSNAWGGTIAAYTVPEPSTYVLFGLALVALAWSGSRCTRRRLN